MTNIKSPRKPKNTQQRKVRQPKLEVGKAYRNRLGKPLMIFGTVDPSSSWYKEGFRFVDERGSFYTENGSVKSKFFAELDVVSEIGLDDITDREWAIIQRREKTQINNLKKHDDLQALFNKYLPKPIRCAGQFLVKLTNPRTSVIN